MISPYPELEDVEEVLVTDGGHVEPIDVLEDAVCGALGCRRTDRVAIVDPGDGYPRALCTPCRRRYRTRAGARRRPSAAPGGRDAPEGARGGEI